MSDLKTAARVILKDCLKIKKREKVLIITNPHKLDFVHVLLKEAQKITEAKLITIPVARRSGEEPPKYVARKMKLYDIILILTAYSLTHTKASRDAAKAGARIASMPGITEDMMKRAIDINYKLLENQTKKLKKLMEKGKEVRVISNAGTDIRFSIKGRLAETCSGIIRRRMIKNLPAGEVFIAPVEGTADGVYKIDGSILRRKIKTKITVIVKEGYAVKIRGGREAKALRETLKDVKDLKAYNIAELGIGINPKAKITGNTLEDEKVKGTCHLAFGNNVGFGGKVNVPVHIDGIIKKPSIFIDGKIIIKDGKFIF
ncbi:aminopeptidase [Candidatus Woesearchaeota archaeon]|nr:aminopeptidase [Candidatus Woesearchaeota archaeon]